MNTVYLSLGTNLGNKLENLSNAIVLLNTIGSVEKISSVYQTPPWGFESDDFYNIALLFKTTTNSDLLIDQLLAIEKELGRKRNPTSKGYQARPLDIDIIFFNNDVIATEKLTIPHPRMQDRNFVLIPLKDLTKSYLHPVFNKTITTLIAETKDTSSIVKTEHSL